MIQNILSNDMKNKFLKKLEEFKCFVLVMIRFLVNFIILNKKMTIKHFKQHIKTEKHKNSQRTCEKSTKLIDRGYLNNNEMDADILNLICKAI